MPIRINLLAEQQAAEEMRRRDPVKRAAWAGGGVVALVLLYSLNLYFNISRGRSELDRLSGRWTQLEPGYLQLSNNFVELGNITRRADSLRHHATNRFFWTNPLNALQHVAVPKVRLVKLNGFQTLTEEAGKAITTNFVANRPEKSWWKFWGQRPGTNIDGLVDQTLNQLTNRADLAPYQPELSARVSIKTNQIRVTGNLQVTKPETITEHISLTLEARDYSNPPGQQIDAFYRAVTNAPYFKYVLNRTNSSPQPDSIQPVDDPRDLIDPKDPFIPFRLECRLPETIRANE